MKPNNIHKVIFLILSTLLMVGSLYGFTATFEQSEDGSYLAWRFIYGVSTTVAFIGMINSTPD